VTTVNGVSGYAASLDTQGNYSTLTLERTAANTHFDSYMHVTRGVRFEFHTLL